MVKLTIQEDGTIAISGKTFEHKDTLQQMGAKWKPTTKTWIVKNTPVNATLLKSLRTVRCCGHCGETGHTKPKCDKYQTSHRMELQARSDELLEKPGGNFKRMANTGFCQCIFEPRSFGYKDFTVLMPFTCSACHMWCCDKACPIEGNIHNYTCERHGSSMDKFLNDTRGT
jgi:hypothetical protein